MEAPPDSDICKSKTNIVPEYVYHQRVELRALMKFIYRLSPLTFLVVAHPQPAPEEIPNKSVNLTQISFQPTFVVLIHGARMFMPRPLQCW